MNSKARSLSRLIVALACGAVPLAATAADVVARPGAVPAEQKLIERGQYLVMITGCNDCHTPNFLATGSKIPEKDRLVGSALGWRGPWGTTYAANLRLYFQGITEQQWIVTAKEMQRRPPMPYFSLNAMSTADLRAIYRYIRHLGPAGAPAPKSLPADKEPPQPFVQLPAYQ